MIGCLTFQRCYSTGYADVVDESTSNSSTLYSTLWQFHV